MINSRWSTRLVFVACLAGTGVAWAGDYSVDGGIYFRFPSPEQPLTLESFSVQDSGSPVGRGVTDAQNISVDATGGVKDFSGQADAIADYGLHAHTFVQIIHNVSQPANPFGDPSQYGAQSNVRIAYNDFVISGPAGTTTTVTPIHIHLKGSQLLEYYVPSPPLFVTDTASSQILVQLASGDSDGGAFTTQSVDGSSPSISASGMLSTFNGNMDLVTKPFTVPVNTPFGINLYLTVSSDLRVDFQDSFITAANNDFGGTLTLATDVPVFDLAPGFTANSLQAGVVNNQFSVPAPEPATMAALGFGVLGLLARRRSPRRN